MAVSQPNLTVSLARNSSCTALYLADLTGIVGEDDNVDGYGPDTVLVNDVTTLVVVLTYNSIATTITYTFTIASGVITACTLKIASGTPANIFAELTSTTWPFTTTLPFNLFGDYGVSIPAFQDDIYSVAYTISGDHDAEAFEFTAVDTEPVTCAVQYCIDQKFVELDWACECAATKSKTALLGQAYINKTIAATTQGDLSTALASLAKAQEVCGITTGGCGCS
jgi:hypothetical protein